MTDCRSAYGPTEGSPSPKWNTARTNQLRWKPFQEREDHIKTVGEGTTGNHRQSQGMKEKEDLNFKYGSFNT